MSNKTLAVVAFVLAFVFPPAGLVLGITALVKAKKENGEGKGLSIAAIILSAIFIVVLMFLTYIVYLAYFGVVNPEQLKTPTTSTHSSSEADCIFVEGFACIDSAFSSGSLSLILQNIMGRDVTISTVTATAVSQSSKPLPEKTCRFSGKVSLPAGSSEKFTLPDCDFKEGGRNVYHYYLTVFYVFDDSGVEQIKGGDLFDWSRA